MCQGFPRELVAKIIIFLGFLTSYTKYKTVSMFFALKNLFLNTPNVDHDPTADVNISTYGDF